MPTTSRALSAKLVRHSCSNTSTSPSWLVENGSRAQDGRVDGR
ncbi:hypothetical protein ACFFX0_26055 [Citricoccus parietis]|uniref:Uncharacterized protein n=1 Tax=Citricoccus parietis TaxID=592307 RepID=A0ABV5G684_9MICC